MIHIAVRIRELVSSNVDSLVGKASDRAKMLGLLRTEIEESLVTLHSDLTKSRRHAERLGERAEATAEAAEEWTAKAKIAMDHRREDLARSALLAREDGRNQALRLAEEAAAAQSEIAELEDAIVLLEAKRTEVLAQIRECAATRDGSCEGDSKAERHLDRIERMERRVDYGAEPRAEPAPASIEAEIAALKRDSELAAELAAMKAAAAPAKRKAR